MCHGDFRNFLECPSSAKVQTCTPKCLHDSECSAIGGKCCPNLCNGRSCVQSNLLSNAGSRDTSPFSKNCKLSKNLIQILYEIQYSDLFSLCI